jgi:hypothetical protein
MTLNETRLKDATNARKKLGLIAEDLALLADASTNTLIRHDLWQSVHEIQAARATLTEAMKELRKEAGR